MDAAKEDQETKMMLGIPHASGFGRCGISLHYIAERQMRTKLIVLLSQPRACWSP